MRRKSQLYKNTDMKDENRKVLNTSKINFNHPVIEESIDDLFDDQANSQSLSSKS